MCSHISRRREQTRCDLPLNAEVPRVLFGAPQILRDGIETLIQRGAWKLRTLWIEVVREGIAAWNVLVRIVKCASPKTINYGQAERRDSGGVLMKILPDKIIRN